MRKKQVLSIALLLCFLFSFAGCGKLKEGKAFAMPIFDEPISLDPQIAHSNAEKLVAANCYEGLVTLDASGNILPGVAEAYSVSSNGTLYQFTLRQNTNWCVFSKHSGLLKEKYGEKFKENFPKQVTADDFVFALERVLNPQTQSEDAYLFSAIDSVVAKDDFSLEITLKYPDENFLFALTTPGAMPCNRAFFTLCNGRYGLETGYTLCNGPFHLASWQEKTSLKLNQNDGYRGEHTVAPASVTLYYNKDASQLVEKMQNSVYDVAFLTAKEYALLDNQEEYVAQEVTDTTLSFLFNQSVAALSNENMRIALAKAMDLNSLKATPHTLYANALIPPFCKIGTEPLHTAEEGATGYIAHDEKGAVAAFQEALLELGKTSVEVEVLCTSEQETFVREIMQQWQKTLGVKFVATVSVMDTQTLTATMASGDYQIALFPVRSYSHFIPDFLEQFGRDASMHFEDETYQAMLQSMRKSSADFDALKASAKEAENYLLEHAVLLPVQYEHNYFLTKKDTEGIYFYASRNYVYFIEAKKK